MDTELLEILRCPQTGKRFILKNPEFCEGRVVSGGLTTEDGKQSYPIRNFIPRFVGASNYADNFGIQWQKFRETQLDSRSGRSISADRFWQATGWSPSDMAGKWLLDAGCGAGRFAEVALSTGARVVALDYSGAVDACHANLRHHKNINIVQGDIYALPFAKESFAFVYSLGVLQHTPNVAKAFAALPPMVAPDGSLCTDFYWKRVRTMMHAKYLFRPVTKRLPQKFLLQFLKLSVPIMLPVSQFLGRLPLGGKFLKRMVPVADYTGVYPLSAEQIREWAFLDTYDMLAPAYDNPQTVATVEGWLAQAGLVDTKVFQAGHLVGRGRKPR